MNDAARGEYPNSHTKTRKRATPNEIAASLLSERIGYWPTLFQGANQAAEAGTKAELCLLVMLIVVVDVASELKSSIILCANGSGCL